MWLPEPRRMGPRANEAWGPGVARPPDANRADGERKALRSLSGRLHEPVAASAVSRRSRA